MAITLDMFEYANDGLAQAAYPTSEEYGPDVCSGGTPTASVSGGGTPASNAFDDNTGTSWTTRYTTRSSSVAQVSVTGY